MTHQQKIIVIALAAVNAIIFCCAVPAFVLFGGSTSGPQVAVNPTAARAVPTIAPTSTATATPTPQATNTFVLGPKPTAPRATVTPRSLQASWKFYDVSSEGFAMALPPNWEKVDFDRDKLAALMRTMNEKNPQFASALASQSDQLIATNVKFFGFDLSNDALSSGFVTNVNVYREQLAFAVPFDTYVQLSIQNLEKLPNISKPVTQKRVKLPAGNAESVQYQLTLTTSQGKITTSTTQYLLVHEKSGYILTFTTRPETEKTYAPLFQKMAQSFQWVP